MNEKVLYAVDDRGTRLARLELAEGATWRDAEIFLLQGGVRGAHTIDVESGGASVRDELVAAFKESGFSDDVAARMADVDRNPLEDFGLPVVTVPVWTPREGTKPSRTLQIGEKARTVGNRLPGALQSVELNEHHGLLGSFVTVGGKVIR